MTKAEATEKLKVLQARIDQTSSVESINASPLQEEIRKILGIDLEITGESCLVKTKTLPRNGYCLL